MELVRRSFALTSGGDEIKLNFFFVGDPEDRTLRKVEKEVMVPKVMRERAKVEKCFEEVAAFQSCCKDSSVLMVVTCRKENEGLKACLTKWYQNESFKQECTEIYLAERAEFRRTGLQKKHREYLKKREQAGIA